MGVERGTTIGWWGGPLGPRATSRSHVARSTIDTHWLPSPALHTRGFLRCSSGYFRIRFGAGSGDRSFLPAKTGFLSAPTSHWLVWRLCLSMILSVWATAPSVLRACEHDSALLRTRVSDSARGPWHCSAGLPRPCRRWVVDASRMIRCGLRLIADPWQRMLVRR